MLATRAAVDRCRPGHVCAPQRKAPEDGQGREEVRVEVHGQFPGEPPLHTAGTLYFAMDVDGVPVAGGSRSDRLAPVSGPQEWVQRHIVEQLVDSALWLRVLGAPVPLMWSGGAVGSVLSPWEPLPPPACVRSCRELAAGVLADLSQLEQVTRGGASQVCNWVARSWRSLTQDELRSVVMLMSGYTGGATASPGRYTNVGAVLRCPQIQEQIVDVEAPVADVLVIMQVVFQQLEIVKVPQFYFVERVLDIPVAGCPRCKLWSRTSRFHWCSSLVWVLTRPLLCYDPESAAGLVVDVLETMLRQVFHSSRLWTSLRPCSDKFTGSSDQFVHRQGVEDLRRARSLHFTAFFALRPFGRQVPVRSFWGALDSQQLLVIEGSRLHN